MSPHNKNTTLIKTVSIALLFIIFVIVLIIANLIASLKGDPYLSFFERLQPSFYIRTMLILLFSTLLYTPISYGVTNVIWRGEQRQTNITDFFYLFSKPIVLLKATILRLLIWVIRGFYQLITLLCGIVLETLVCFFHLAAVGENVLYLSIRDLPGSIDRILEYNSFRWLSVMLWVCVLVVLIVTFLRFMLCKYALLRYEELSPIEAIRIAHLAVAGRFFLFCFRLLQNYSYYILFYGSFGLLHRFLKKHKSSSFCSLAMRWVEQGRELYFWKKVKGS